MDGYEDDVEVRAVNPRSARRASLKMGRRASAGGFGHGGGGGDDFAGGNFHNYPQQPPPITVKKNRRASLSGAGNMESSTYYPHGEVVPQCGANRRASFSGPDSPNFITRQRRGSAAGKQRMPGMEVQIRHSTAGINSDVVARMSHKTSKRTVVDDDDDDDESVNYGYGAGAYYGTKPVAHPKVSRRPSNDSYASRVSTLSRRRGDPRIVTEITTTHQMEPESDIGSSSSSSDSDEGSNPYGYGATTTHQKPQQVSDPYGYESDANASRASARSSRSHRRNSCIIRKEADPRFAAELLANGPKLVPDNEIDESSGQKNGPRAYGAYGYGAPPPTKQRPNHVSDPYGYESDANESRASARSNRSHRRNSCIIRKDADPRFAAELLANGPKLVPDNDLDESSEDDSLPRAYGGYGYDIGGGAVGGGGIHPFTNQNAMGYESDSTAGGSVSTNKRTKRRNSCFTGNLADALGKVDGEGPDDLKDPDSLLSRSGFFKKLSVTKQQPAKAMCELSDDSQVKEDTVNKEEEDDRLFRIPDVGPLAAKKIEKKSVPPRPLGAVQNPANAYISSPEDGDWSRAVPFTTSYTAPTIDQLQSSSKHKPVSKNNALQQGLHSNWGEMDITSNPSSSEESDESFGASMYVDSKVNEEFDKYKQRARRRASIEASCIIMEDKVVLSPVKERVDKKAEVCTFKPADGCSIASDFIVRCFAARLRAGITVLKHNRSRWSKSQHRILYLLPDGKTLSWKPVEGEKDKGKRPKMDLSRCIEVRHAWSADPETRNKQGTAILRKSCKEGMAARSLSLVFNKRTFDMTALSNDLCKVLLEGFSALCFRLNLVRVEEEEHAKDFSIEMNATGNADDDWASTVYGGVETTVSMSITNTTRSGPNDEPLVETPWGF